MAENIVQFKSHTQLQKEQSQRGAEEIKRQLREALLEALEQVEADEIKHLCVFADSGAGSSIKTIITPSLWYNAVELIGFTELLKAQLIESISRATYVETGDDDEGDEE